MSDVRYSAAEVLAGRAGEAELVDVRVHSSWGGGTRSDLTAGRHRLRADEPVARGGEDAGPTPLQLILAGLCSCETVTMHRMAQKIRMPVEAFEIAAHGVIDARGRSGLAEVPAHFLRVEVRARVRTPEPAERVQRLKELVERHCPVATLLQAAPLQYDSVWERMEGQ